jgi:hypothetical protein
MTSNSEIILKINLNEFPMLKSFKKKDQDKTIIELFKLGYKLTFPNKDENQNNNELKEMSFQIQNLKTQIEESNLMDISDSILEKIGEKIDPLNSSLNKLLGLQNASSKKGELGENIIQNAFTTRYGDIIYEDMSKVDHSGDAWVILPNKEKVLIEAKNYTKTISQKEIDKMENDMKFNHIRFALFLGLNQPVQGFRDMDFHSFTHNNELYFAIIVSNLSNDIAKLDLAFSMIRKLMELLNTPEKFPWIQTKIKEDLNKVNDIINKNYLLRDNFNILDKSINASLDIYHQQIRDYQYEMELIIKDLTKNINSTMSDSIEIKKTIKDTINIHKTKPIYSVISTIGDTLEKKKCELKNIADNKYEIYIKGIKIAKFDIQTKKAIINFHNNQLDLTFITGNKKQNSANLKILETNF